MATLIGEAPATAPAITRVGVARAELDASDELVRTAVTPAIEQLALPLVDIELPDGDGVAQATTTVLFGEFARANADLTADQRRRLGDDIRGRLEAGEAIGAAELDEALTRLDDFRAEVDALLTTVEAIVLPTLPIVPPTIEEADADPVAAAKALVRYTRLANATGHPAITVPVPAALPVGLQLIGPQAVVFELARRATTE
jgi:amidase